MHPHKLLLAMLLVGTTLSMMPAGQAAATCNGANGSEDFEGYSNLYPPNYPDSSNCLYSHGLTTGGIVTSATTPPGTGGSRAYYTNGDSIQFDLSKGGTVVGPCTSPSNIAGISYEFDFRTTATAPTGGTSHQVAGVFLGEGGGSGSRLVGVGFRSDMNPVVLVKTTGSAGTQLFFGSPPTLALDTWYHAGFTIQNCSTPTVSAFIVISGTTYGVVTGGTGSFSAILNSLRYISQNFPDSGTPVIGAVNGYIDNIVVSGFSSTGAGAGAIFCPDEYINEPTGTGNTPNYGYTYRRGGTFFDQSEGNVAGIGLSTGYLFQGDTGDETTWDYSAKGLTTGTLAAHWNITLEGATDGAASNMRLAFNTVSGATPSSTTKGTDGNENMNTGNFANHAEAQFVEAGNTWQVSLWYVTGGGTRTQIGSFANYGNSNDATDFTVYLDDRAPNPYISVVTETGQLLSSNGTGANAAAFRMAFSSDTIYDFWLIGAGIGGILDAKTAVDENQQHDLPNTDDEGGHDSTCIFDDVGTAVTLGTSGVLPGSQVEQPPSEEDMGCDSFLCTDASTVPAGFTVAAFNGFLGLVLVAMVGVGGATAAFGGDTKAKGFGFIFGVFAILGYLMGLYFGLLPLWPLILLGVVGAAVVFLKLKGAGSGG